MASYKYFVIQRRVYSGDNLLCIDEATAGGSHAEEAMEEIDWPEIRGEFAAREATDEEMEEYYREQGEQTATDTSPIICD
jgi:hypothetical protein